jgi:hypothetical protein
MKYKPELTEQQIDMIDDALRSYYDAHFDPESDKQPTADLLEMICDARFELSRVLPCSEEGCENNRMGHHSDLCLEHYLQLTRGELKVRVA